MVKTEKPKRANGDPLLSLEQFAATEYVRMPDGATYDLASFDLFSLRQRVEVKGLVERVTVLEAMTEPTEADDQEYRSRLLELCTIALPKAPAVELEKLTTGQRGDVAGAFFVPLLDRPGMKLLAKVRSRISASSSPDSTATTPRPVPRSG